MSLSATCKAKCDGCGKTVINEVELNDQTAEGIMSHEDHGEGTVARTYASDIWSWCWPQGWIQCANPDKVTGEKWLFFCSRECRIEWLEKQGRHEEAEEFKNAIWMG